MIFYRIDFVNSFFFISWYNKNITNTSVNNLISTNNTVNNTSNTTQNNVSSYNNVANKANTSAGLPYTGSNSSMVLMVVAFVGSAIYAYKKVKEYNA